MIINLSPRSRTSMPPLNRRLLAMTEQQIWLAVVRGKNKNQVFVLGFEAHVSSRTFTSPSPPPNPAMEDHIDCLKMMMTDMMPMTTKMRASSSTVALPPTNPPASNQDDMDIADKEGLD
ncbi:UNVERIFIED_CONTAM: hypothetical protein Sindi_2032800 [Sesamum indicum]